MYQTDPPISPQDVLPTMYDLKSEDPEEPGLPDQFHLLQPRLLDETFHSPTYSSDKIFTASDLNLYYDSRFWMPEIELGLGVWEGSYQNIHQRWLRWYDNTGNWVLTPTEAERRHKERLIAQLRALGVEPDLE
jgi:hypothetical protein